MCSSTKREIYYMQKYAKKQLYNGPRLSGKETRGLQSKSVFPFNVMWCDEASSSRFLRAVFKFIFQDSPTNKLLYAKEIPEYKKRVQLYYQQIQEMAPLSEQEMNAHLAEESRVSQVYKTCVNWDSVPEGGLIKAIFHSAEVSKRIQHQPGLDRDLQICQKIQKPGESVVFWSHRSNSLLLLLFSLAQIAIRAWCTVSVTTIMCTLDCNVL